MEGIENPTENEICLVYSKIQQHPQENSQFSKAIIRHEVILDEASTGSWMEFGTSDFNNRLSVNVGASAAKYVYLGDGTNWNLIASNIYTEEA